MQTLLLDLKFAFRQLLKNPGFTAVAVLTLALGIGANTTVFCWLQRVVLRPLTGVTDPARLVVLTTARGTTQWDGVSLPDLKDCRALTNIFSSVFGSQVTPACLMVDQQTEWIYGQITTANFFEALGVKPLLGRPFLADEDLKPGGHPVLVLSEGFWRRRFAADPNVIGRVVNLNKLPFTIVGVVPADFHGTMSGLKCDFWAPLAMHEQVANFGSLQARGDRWLHTQAKLRPGVPRQQAQAAVNTLATQLTSDYPDTNREIGLRVLPFWKAPYGAVAMMLPVLSLLLAVSLGVLLIVAANIANLLLARATGRQKEIAIRLAMGAGRRHLIKQLLTESVLLALLGGAGGVLLASWGRGLFATFIPRTHLPIGFDFQLNPQTLGFTLLLTGLIFGLAPALQSTRANLNNTLKERGRSSVANSPHHRLRSALVVVEIALALLLLVGAGLCIQGLERARRIDVGFDPNHVLVAGLRIGMHGYDERTGMIFYRQLRERLATAPGVKEVGLGSWLPLGFEGGAA